MQEYRVEIIKKNSDNTYEIGITDEKHIRAYELRLLGIICQYMDNMDPCFNKYICRKIVRVGIEPSGDIIFLDVENNEEMIGRASNKYDEICELTEFAGYEIHEEISYRDNILKIVTKCQIGLN